MWLISVPKTSLPKELRKYNCTNREEWILVTILANGKCDNSRPVLWTVAATVRETVTGVIVLARSPWGRLELEPSDESCRFQPCVRLPYYLDCQINKGYSWRLRVVKSSAWRNTVCAYYSVLHLLRQPKTLMKCRRLCLQKLFKQSPPYKESKLRTQSWYNSQWHKIGNHWTLRQNIGISYSTWQVILI